MQTSITLLERALQGRRYVDLADAIGVHHTAIANSKKVGHLSALLAGQIAVFLNEDVPKWMAIAAVESAREGKAKRQLMRALEPHVKSSLNTGQIRLQQWTQNRPQRPFFTPGRLKFFYRSIDCCVG